MSASDKPSAANRDPAGDFDDLYRSNDVARELMMPTGEAAVAAIGACLLLGMIWFAAAGHGPGAAQATHAAAAAAAAAERPGPGASGGPIAAPIAHRSAG